MKAVFLSDDALLDQSHGGLPPRCLRLQHGAGTALRMLSRFDYRVVVISVVMRTQDGMVDAVERRLADLLFREQLALDGFYHCPHHPEGSLSTFAIGCICRAPMPGLLLQAAHEHDIDLPASWMIGTRLQDIEAGNRAGCNTLLIDNGSETEWRLGQRRIPDRIAPDLYGAAVLISGEEYA